MNKPLLLIIALFSGSFLYSQIEIHYVERSSGLNNKVAWKNGKTEIEFGDLNNDGNPDLVTIGDHASGTVYQQNGIMVWFSDGVGDSWNTFYQSGKFGYGGVAIGDVNNDGNMDVGYGQHHNYYPEGEFGDEFMEVVTGDGTGRNWTMMETGLQSQGESWGMFEADFGDVDNDGDLDFATISFGYRNGVKIYGNNGDGTWTYMAGYDGGNVGSGLEFGDMDGDGNLDIVAGSAYGNVYFGDGKGGFSSIGFRGGLPSPNKSGDLHVKAADLTGDGGEDLIYIDRSTGGVMLFDCDPSSRTWSQIIAPTGVFSIAEPADMDNDGNMDLVTFADTTLQVWLGDGGISWTLMASINNPSTNAVDMAIADINKSGYPDIMFFGEKVTTSGFTVTKKNRLYFYRDSAVTGQSSCASVNIELSVSTSFQSDCDRDGGTLGEATVSATGGAGSYAYKWDDINQQSSKTAIGLSPGTYTVEVTDNNGCGSSASVTIEEKIKLDVTTTPGTCSNCNDGQASVSATGSGVEPFTFRWTDESGTTVSTDPVASGLSPGTYKVVATDAGGCRKEKTVKVTAAVGIENVYDSDQIKLYPNPADLAFTIKGLRKRANAVKISIFDLTGKVMFAADFHSTDELKVDIPFLSEGVYLLQIQAADVFVKKPLYIK